MARNLGIAERLPERRKKRATVSVHLAAVVFLDRSGNSLILAPPPETSGRETSDHVPSLVAKLWHFPTLAVGDNAERTVKKFLCGALKVNGVPRLRLQALEKVSHTVTYRRITVFPFTFQVKTLPQIERAKQLELGKILEMPISNLTRKVAKAALASLPIQNK
jgi:hypothetical protein